MLELMWMLLMFFSDWNPSTDKHIPFNYDVSNFVEGKRLNKMKLQVRL
jgi:hypothetical protein